MWMSAIGADGAPSTSSPALKHMQQSRLDSCVFIVHHAYNAADLQGTPHCMSGQAILPLRQQGNAPLRVPDHTQRSHKGRLEATCIPSTDRAPRCRWACVTAPKAHEAAAGSALQCTFLLSRHKAHASIYASICAISCILVQSWLVSIGQSY